MDSNWLTLLLQALFWIAGMTLFKRWLSRERLRPRKAAEAMQLVQPRVILILGLLSTVFFGALWIASRVWPDGSASIFTDVVFISLALIGMYLVLEYFVVRHTVDEQGMAYARMFKAHGRLLWSDVELVDFNRSMNWYRLALSSGATVRVSATMMGQPLFARHVLDHVPAQRISPEARPILDGAVNGDLPKL